LDGAERVKGAIFLGLLLVAVTLLTGCGGDDASAEEGKYLVLGDIGWEEGAAVSNLTKVLLEEELEYDSVSLRPMDVRLLFEGVASGELNAFQDVWLPNHQRYLDTNKVELLNDWYEGETSFGVAVPSYVQATSFENLTESGVEEILGIAPGAEIMPKLQEEVIPAYSLDQELVELSTNEMLAEVERRYEDGEKFVFIAWSPHWMNHRYDFRYLDDPLDAQGELNDPARLSTAVNQDLQEDDPAAYAFLNSVRLNEAQLNELEDEIERAEDPETGVISWLEDNREAVEPWLEAARDARLRKRPRGTSPDITDTVLRRVLRGATVAPNWQ
jgi:glycine betaine/proline transport system substrate-binding protein